jgi:hypothetical protein
VKIENNQRPLGFRPAAFLFDALFLDNDVDSCDRSVVDCINF